MNVLILFGIAIFFLIGVFPMTLMVYATIRDKRELAEKNAKEASGE